MGTSDSPDRNRPETSSGADTGQPIRRFLPLEAIISDLDLPGSATADLDPYNAVFVRLRDSEDPSTAVGGSGPEINLDFSGVSVPGAHENTDQQSSTTEASDLSIESERAEETTAEVDVDFEPVSIDLGSDAQSPTTESNSGIPDQPHENDEASIDEESSSADEIPGNSTPDTLPEVTDRFEASPADIWNGDQSDGPAAFGGSNNRNNRDDDVRSSSSPLQEPSVTDVHEGEDSPSITQDEVPPEQPDHSSSAEAEATPDPYQDLPQVESPVRSPMQMARDAHVTYTRGLHTTTRAVGRFLRWTMNALGAFAFYITPVLVLIYFLNSVLIVIASPPTSSSRLFLWINLTVNLGGTTVGCLLFSIVVDAVFNDGQRFG